MFKISLVASVFCGKWLVGPIIRVATGDEINQSGVLSLNLAVRQVDVYKVTVSLMNA